VGVPGGSRAASFFHAELIADRRDILARIRRRMLKTGSLSLRRVSATSILGPTAEPSCASIAKHAPQLDFPGLARSWATAAFFSDEATRPIKGRGRHRFANARRTRRGEILPFAVAEPRVSPPNHSAGSL
jgi:hypothetical protein